jgi:hypothetical protein
MLDAMPLPHGRDRDVSRFWPPADLIWTAADAFQYVVCHGHRRVQRRVLSASPKCKWRCDILTTNPRRNTVVALRHVMPQVTLA